MVRGVEVATLAPGAPRHQPAAAWPHRDLRRPVRPRGDLQLDPRARSVETTSGRPRVVVVRERPVQTDGFLAQYRWVADHLLQRTGARDPTGHDLFERRHGGHGGTPPLLSSRCNSRYGSQFSCATDNVVGWVSPRAGGGKAPLPPPPPTSASGGRPPGV